MQNLNNDNVNLDSLISWQKSLNDTVGNSFVEDPLNLKERRIKSDLHINKKVYLWKGDICKLVIDCIVNPLSEQLYHPEGLCARIFKQAGPELLKEFHKQQGRPSGETKITGGCNLIARNVIHTTGPKYLSKYKDAADDALHICYRSTLELMVENKLQTIAFPIIALPNNSHPIVEGAHIALRTVRRFLEKFGEGINAVVFCVEDNDSYVLYEKTMPLYFPRDDNEEIFSAQFLPTDIGDANGEPFIEERKIRISAFPGTSTDDQFDEPITSKIESKYVLASGFSDMQDDPDRKRKVAIKESDVDIYSKYANAEIESERIKKLNVVYSPGNDSKGRPIVVVIGKNIPENNEVLLEKIVTYIVNLMDSVSTSSYVLVYCHSGMSSKSTPDLGWLKTLHTLFDIKYSKNIYRFYVLHPTFWLKAFLTVMSPILNKTLKEKLEYIDNLKDLFQFCTQKQLQLPDDIYQLE